MSEEIVSHEHSVDNNRTPGRIILAGWPITAVSAVHNLLSRAGLKTSTGLERDNVGRNPFTDRLVSLRKPSDIELIRRELVKDEKSIVLVCVEDLADVLARALAEDSDAGLEVARQWVSAVDRLLAMVENEPGHYCMVSTSDALVKPEMFIAYLSDALSTSLDFYRSPEIPAKHKWDDFYLLLAHRVISDNPEWRRMATLLESIRDFGADSGDEKWGQVDWSSVRQDVEAMRSENGILLEMLHRVQLEFEDTMSKLGEAEEKLQLRTNELDEVSGNLQDQKTKNAELTEAQNQLSAKHSELSTKHNELSTKHTELSTKHKELATKHSQLSAKQNEISAKLEQEQSKVKAMQDSTSWKITGPMRKIVRQFER